MKVVELAEVVSAGVGSCDGSELICHTYCLEWLL